ncbi:PfkB family carbohydrate kinase [Jannaschia rubra]|uniref:PfkB family carbohydrate kinase n=1 Tax=Jannaschia rubra TaxID=282197 RepID=UPI002493060E|nr:PfkB family carbohydrate kinase [Jannaschia rubra]
MRAIVIGNVALDETFAVEALPQGGESIFGSHRHAGLGGKGANQAVMLARCGLSVRLRCAVGDDVASETVRSLLAVEPLTSDLHLVPATATDRSIILSDATGANVIVTTTDCAGAMRPRDALPALDDAGAGDLLVLQGNLTQDVTMALIDAGRARGMTVVFNPSPTRIWMSEALTRVDLAFLNEAEAELLTGLRGEAAVAAMLRAGRGIVALTSGGGGALLGRGDEIVHVPARPAKVVDTTGAGDTFQSVAIASAQRRGRPLAVEDLTRAAAAAGLAVSRFGSLSAMPSVAEARAILDHPAMDDRTA